MILKLSKSCPKIAVGLSGGVDSAIALLLLKQQGYFPVGVYFNYNNKTKNLKTAKKICKKFNIKFYSVDKRQEFKNKIIKYFLETLKKNKTPNPCVVCNKRVKIKNLLDFAKKKKIKFISTGHYARIKKTKNKYQLLKAKDKTKDQTYFLCLLNQNYLKKLVFPLGNYTKEQVYKIAKKNKLNFLVKQKESQDLCFDSQKIIKKNIKNNPGKIVDTNGNILGKHKGLHFYTIGQRKGINLSGGPWRVVGFNKIKNYLIITNNIKNKFLYTKNLYIKNNNFINNIKLNKKITRPRRVRLGRKIKTKTRYNSLAVPAMLYILKNKKLKLIFNKPQKAITTGQYAVFYKGEICLGGGVIE